eukprot:scaffold22753_cov18-Tisochrysis_lutea.AAC.2
MCSIPCKEAHDIQQWHAPGLKTQQGARQPELLTCVWAAEIAATLSIASIEDGGMSSPNSAATAMAMCIEVQSLERGVAGSCAQGMQGKVGKTAVYARISWKHWPSVLACLFHSAPQRRA